MDAAGVAYVYNGGGSKSHAMPESDEMAAKRLQKISAEAYTTVWSWDKHHFGADSATLYRNRQNRDSETGQLVSKRGR